MNAESPWNKAGWVLITLIVMSAYGYVALRSIFSGPESGHGLIPLKEPEKHVATESMLRTADAMSAIEAPRFSARDGDGIVQDSQSPQFVLPAVLVFIKNGCPCSVAAQPYFARIAAAFAGAATVFGVIDGDVGTAAAWGEKYRAGVPVLADERLEIVRSYNAESSVHVVLIGTNRRIVRVWPGYSREMLIELVGLLEKATGRKVTGFDFTDAPDDLMAGCPFDFP